MKISPVETQMPEAKVFDVYCNLNKLAVQWKLRVMNYSLWSTIGLEMIFVPPRVPLLSLSGT